MDHVQWDGGPHAPRVAGPQLALLDDGGREFFRLLDEPLRVRTHWVTDTMLRPKGRTLPCLGQHCKHCPALQKTHAYGPALRWVRTSYAPTRAGEKGGEWGPCVMHLPEMTWNLLVLDLIAVYGEKPIPWRGMVLDVSRRAHTWKANMLERQVSDPLPETFDVKPVLRRIWGITDKFVHQQEPQPGVIPFKQKGA